MDCSDIDDIVAITSEGKMIISKVDSKTFIGKNIIMLMSLRKKTKEQLTTLYTEMETGHLSLRGLMLQ